MSTSEPREIAAEILPFREALEEALHESGIGHPSAYAGADAILAMHEMQAIRRFIQTHTDMGNRWSWLAPLPEVVELWVVAE